MPPFVHSSLPPFINEACRVGILLLLGFLAIGIGTLTPAHAQQVTLRTSIVSAGGELAAGGDHRLHSTIGTFGAGTLSSTDHVLHGGFWPQVRPPADDAVRPVVMQDSITTDEDASFTIRPLDNDTDPAGGALSITSVTQPDSGAVEQVSDTELTYTPNADFNGQDSFTYTATNAQGGSATGTVAVTVDPVNDAPRFTTEPVMDAAAGAEYTYAMAASDVDGDVLALAAPTLPAWLAFADVGDGRATLTGTPTSADAGEHEVTLQVDDGTLTAQQNFVIIVAVGVPATPTLVAPQDADEDLPTTVTLGWEAVASASSYGAQVATTDDFATTVRDTTGVTTTTLEIEGLAGGTTYFWRVRAVNGAGASSFTPPFRFTTAVDVATEADALPDQFALAQNYPNPFNPSTTIVFELPAPSHVRLTVYDVYGRSVATLVEGKWPAGRHEVTFDASQLASGIYLYRMEAGEFEDTRPMILAQ